MTEKDSKQPPSKNDATRKPRGLGGVVLIIGLLTALFIVVSSAGMEDHSGLYQFYQRLLNCQIQEARLEEHTLTARYVDNMGRPRQMEIVLKGFEKDAELIRDLLPRKLDVDTYTGDKALDDFIADLENDEIEIERAFFVTELAGHEDVPQEGAEPIVESQYLTAIILKGNQQIYVRIDPDRSTATLQTAKTLLRNKNIETRSFPLSLSPKTFSITQPNTALTYFLSAIGPYLILILIIWFFVIRQMRSPGGSGGVLSFGRSRAALYTKENRTNITFEDVAGVDEAKDELREIIEFLKHPDKFSKLGGSIPRGVLLVGAPGTGKTLMAKAIAGEADVPFFNISGSDFVEMFVGVGASRVRDLFKQARECSPCLVFLDEIDAVGRKRGSGMGGGHDEREQTLNAILVEMDGFNSDKGIILIGATNRPDVLDPALLRPGRFDRQISIDMPDVRGREEILRVHARKVKMVPEIDLKKIARATAGFSGADLAAVINEGAILAAMKGKDAVNIHELEEARDRVRWGREKRSRAMEEEDRKVTAYHEAGHALVSSLIPELDPVHKVTIVSRGMALGATMSLPERDDYHMRKKKLLGMIAMCYGGRVAEELEFGDVSAGAQNDIEKATHLAKVMVCELGMSDQVGPIRYSVEQENPFLGKSFKMAPDVSPQTLELIDQEVGAIVRSQYERARDLINEHRDKLSLVADGLLKYETITGEEVSAVMRGDTIEGVRAAEERRNQEQAARPEPTEQEDPDLSGAEGLVHP